MPWENDNLDQDILQCRQDIQKARQRLSPSSDSQPPEKDRIPIEEIPAQADSEPIDASFTTEPLHPAADEKTDTPPIEETEPKTQERIPSFEEVIHHHAQLQQEMNDSEETSSETANDEQDDEPAQLHVEVNRKIEEIDLEPPKQEDSEQHAAQTAYDITQQEIDELEKQWSDNTLYDGNPYLQSQVEQAESNVEDRDEPPQTLNDEEDKILEELIHQSEGYQDAATKSGHVVPEETGQADLASTNTDPDNEETDIPSFDLARQILAQKRNDIAKRRKGPASPQKNQPGYQAQGTVAEVINYSRKNRTTQPDIETESASYERSHSIRFDCEMNPQKKSIIADIVAKDIDTFFNQHSNPNKTGAVS